MYALGLHRDGQSIKAALLKKGAQGFAIELLRSFHFEEEENVKPLYILASILSGKNAQVVTGLNSWEMLLRELSLKVKSPKIALAALPFQVESLIPYPSDEMILTPYLERSDKTGCDFTILATTNSFLKQHLESYKAFEVDPYIVSCIPSALWRWAEFLYPKHLSFFLCYIGVHKSTCIFSDGSLRASQTLNMGIHHLKEALQKDLPEKILSDEMLKEFDLMDMDEKLYPNLTAQKAQMQKELDRLLYFLKSKTSGAENADFFLCGQLSQFHLKDFLESSWSDHPTDGFSIDQYDFSTLQTYAVPIGLALDGLSQDKKKMQLRVGPYLHPTIAKKRKKHLLTYFSSCLALAALIGFCGHFFINKRENLLLEHLNSYVERPFAKNKPIDEAVFEWEKSLGKDNRLTPYLFNLPKVSDVLAYLSAHPQLNGKDIEIKRVRYVLTSYPKVGEKLEPFRAKVELEFTTSSPTLARDFREALMGKDGFIDSKNKITWNFHDNVYYTSFFLNPMRGS